jgi:hypothetical protein
MIIVLVIYYVAMVKYGFTIPSFTPLFPIVIMACWHGGVYSCFSTGILVAGYTVYVVDDPLRVALIIISLIATIIPVSILQWYRRRIGTVSNLMKDMREINSILLAGMVHWPDMNDEEKWQMVESTHHKIADIFTVMRGWHMLAKERSTLDVQQ